MRYSERYSKNWAQISRATEDATGGMCCFPGCWTKGIEAHHAAYRDMEGAIVGREIPGVHVFLLCNCHHSIRHPDGAHNPRNWNKGILPPPTLDACNSAEYYKKLRAGFLEKKAWVQRVKDDPQYRFQTRKNGFKRRRTA